MVVYTSTVQLWTVFRIGLQMEKMITNKYLFIIKSYLRIIPRYRAYSTMRPNANMARSGVG
jgi:hypothetical protein